MIETATAPDVERAVHACLVAMDAAGRSAARCLADPDLASDRETSESSVVAARLLGAFADVAGLGMSNQRRHVTTAMARAALAAAEACATANTGTGIDACTAAADACTLAAIDLRRAIATLESSDLAPGGRHLTTVAS